METTSKEAITVETIVNAPIEKVWKYWTETAHITQWNNASVEWHAPHAENDLRVAGKFKTTMAAKDGSVSFDFEGVYTSIQEFTLIEYTITYGRKVKIEFLSFKNGTKLIETFEAENTNSIELQRGGWQAILNNFKKYVEAN